MLAHQQNYHDDTDGRLEHLMQESTNSRLDDVGLKNLNYTIVTSQYFPLYTWFLVDLPPAPPKMPRTLWRNFQKSFDTGFSFIKDAFKAAKGGKTMTTKDHEEEEDSEELQESDYYIY